MSSVDFDESPATSGTGLLRSKVFTQIEDAILTGKYAPGDGLTEMRLSEEMKVSRTPVREALRQLELEGLVQYIPNKGVVVTGIEWQDIEDIYEIRIRIEGLAACLAAEKITQEELAELEEVVDLTEFYVNKGDFTHLLHLDSQFHDIIFKASKNRPLMHMLKLFHNYVKRARNESLMYPGRSSKVYVEHRNIYLAIKDHDPDMAEKQYVTHIKHTLCNLKKAMMHDNEIADTMNGM